MKQIYEMHADICKTLANSKRIEIINLLGNKEMSVSNLLKKTKLLKANLSQHLTIMKNKGIIKSRKEGLSVYYKISNPKVVKACNLMREVLFEQIKSKEGELKKWKKQI